MPESVTTNEEPQTIEEWKTKCDNLTDALNAVLKLYHGEGFMEGFLSPTTRFELKILGTVGYRELDALIKKLEVDRETFQNEEWIRPEESADAAV